ncbi:MAG: hypothetical protein H7293_20890, partial [Candidatus Saccharibacteria bacterium]|nr:hypothetical protein [Rhodoferax sp.]
MQPVPPPHAASQRRPPAFKIRYQPQLKSVIALGLIGLGALYAHAATSAAADAPPNSEVAIAVEAVAVDPALYTTQTFEWNDVGRNRLVPAKIYLPVGLLKPGAVPLVVFSHGIGGSKDGYSYLG